MTQNKTHRVAFLGTGLISQAHLSALSYVTGTSLVAACDLHAGRLKEFRAKAGAGVELFDDLDVMMDRAKPDAVHILLPPAAHAAAAERCLRAGANVLVEKPLALTTAEARGIEQAARRAGRIVAVNHCSGVFTTPYLRAARVVEQGTLGAVELARVCYRLPAPVGVPLHHWMFADATHLILELAPHPLSLICHLMGGVRTAGVTLSGEQRLANGVRYFRTWSISLDCERGAAQLVIGLGSGLLDATFEIHGQDGMLTADMRRNLVRVHRRGKARRTAEFREVAGAAWGDVRQAARNIRFYLEGILGRGPVYDLHAISIVNSLRDFYNSIETINEPVAGITHGMQVVEACERIAAAGRAALTEAREESQHV